MGDWVPFHTIAWPATYAYYFFVIGISAALFFVSALSWFREEFKPVRSSSFLLSFALLVIGGLLLVADLSQPGRFLNMINPGYWNMASPLMSVLAVSLSLISGAAVASFMAKGEAKLLASLRNIMFASAGATAVMLLALMVTTAYGGSASELTYMFMTSGAMGTVFVWLGVVIGTVVPLVVLALPLGKQATGIMLASVLLLVGGVALRYAILVGPQTVHTYF